jgi:hypothetical protein
MPRFEEVVSVLGTDYLTGKAAASDTGAGRAAIAAAVVFSARVPRADLAEYRIKVCREGELLHVIFVDRERPPGMRGSGGRPNCPGFEVTLAADLAVVKAHFIR